jgi:Leucine-rich repeat (LRR) protein
MECLTLEEANARIATLTAEVETLKSINTGSVVLYGKRYDRNEADLDLAGSDIKSVRELVGFSDILYLDLRGCHQLTSLEGLAEIAPYLQSLNLDGCKHLASLKGVSKLKYLSALTLGRTRVTSLEGLTDLPTLNFLKISSTEISDLSPLLALGIPPDCRFTLDIEKCFSINLAGIAGMRVTFLCAAGNFSTLGDLTSIKGLVGLEELRLSGVPCLTSLEFFRDMRALRVLIVKDCCIESLQGLDLLSDLERVDVELRSRGVLTHVVTVSKARDGRVDR